MEKENYKTSNIRKVLFDNLISTTGERMAGKKLQTPNAVAHSPEPSRQSPLARFSRKLAVGALKIAVPAYITLRVLLPFDVFGQDSKNALRKDVKREVVNVQFSPANGAPIGEVAKDVEVKDGIFTVKNLIINGKKAWIDVSIIDDLTKAGLSKNAELLLPITKIGDVYLLVFNNFLYTARLDFKTQNLIGKGVFAKDNSKIFTHPGAIFIVNDKILATTPTTLLIITPEKAVSITYKELFGEVPALVKPYFRKGNADNLVDLRDDATLGSSKLKIQIKLTDGFTYQVVDDTDILGKK